MLSSRWVDVCPDRLLHWVEGFGERHGGLTAGETAAYGILLRAADGAVADIHAPFPPLPAWSRAERRSACAAAPACRAASGGGAVDGTGRTGDASTPAGAIDPDWVGAALGTITEHAAARRRVGVVLLRLGGYAVGVFDGGELVGSKCGTRLVHARQRNGGSSQARFARRRANEVRAAIDAAADETVRVVLPERRRLDALVCGGDRNAVRALLADRRLTELTPLAVERFLDVPDPRRDVLDRAPALFGAIQVRLTQP